tara:strand:- start:50 stop:457 length:408 start_codon:yes stop_codon:yes gene_type:complete
MSRKPFESWEEIPKGVINSYDIDGVIYMGEGLDGLRPGPRDIVITGRSVETEVLTKKMLSDKGIHNPLYMNNKSKDWNNREQSGFHKGWTLFHLEQIGYRFGIHYDDDPVQIEKIRQMMPHIHIVHVNHDLVPKE